MKKKLELQFSSQAPAGPGDEKVSHVAHHVSYLNLQQI